MNIIDAAKEVQRGKIVQRKLANDLYMQLDKSCFGLNHQRKNWLQFEDLIADDWEIYEELSPKEEAWNKIESTRIFFGEDSKKIGRSLFEEVWSAAEKHFTHQSK